MGVLLVLQESSQRPCQGVVHAPPCGWGCSTCDRQRTPHQTALAHASPRAGTGSSRAPADPWPAWLKQVPAIFMSKLQFTSDLLLSSKGEAAAATPPGRQRDVLPAHRWRTGGYGWERACGHDSERPGGLQEWSAPPAISQRLPNAVQPVRCQKALTPSSPCITQPTFHSTRPCVAHTCLGWSQCF